jgi:hypothetical protein
MSSDRFSTDIKIVISVSLDGEEWGKIEREIPRWQVEGGSRKHASYSEILEKCWRHTLQARPPRRGKTLTHPHLQPAQEVPPVAHAQKAWEDADKVN